jgi:hypothetical protein
MAVAAAPLTGGPGRRAGGRQDDPVMSEERYMEWKSEDITGWDADFVAVDLRTLFDLILVRPRGPRAPAPSPADPASAAARQAANFLDIKHMLDVTCKCLAHKIRGASCDCVLSVGWFWLALRSPPRPCRQDARPDQGGLWHRGRLYARGNRSGARAGHMGLLIFGVGFFCHLFSIPYFCHY